MGIPIIAPVSLILPTRWETGAESEEVSDLLEHTSREFHYADIEQKRVHITAIEDVAAGVPGNLWCWVEISPVASITSTAYWAAIGGGGGAIAPFSPTILVATGGDGTTHSLMLSWSIHAEWVRVVVQTPVAASLPNAFWLVQVSVSGKTP